METLTGRTIQALKKYISDHQLENGFKLGSLNELSQQFGVSRTVIREAVSALRSDGIVESRHGVGVFVRNRPRTDNPEQETYDADLALAPFARLKTSFMDLLELRMAFEVHAAGLAATRRSWAQESNIWNAARQFEASLEDEAALDHLDFIFHRSIAEATNNGAFIEFFSLMSLQILPQPAFSRQLNPALITPDYIQNTVVEHRAICDAISSGISEKAREAMRAHLSRSHLRYRGFSDGTSSPLSNVARDD
ncbi:DNA-binding FadR family transcriptional regulator [Agrobacterium tumefaciens]|uniref:FadR family transcriptional regulator n=1 Tax=Agrobacterium tumefaciens TaxID=358 RepID=A0AAP9E804_AGRTU|nr:FadR/GntR family transcriptional regulator [Agrobacterium tumefaciens]MBP2511265.1 DNA-binding FadR family transcriptional regulator [Agrobacterium tumefaciens]MBP2520634.1 DNA-binding FadR family transcriptional regulator [Agrobacterium tumefaciens]MBP2573723.1 DNA-binding FadR family transcriptional regulator [Agrobacterium tumefaciens]MBP2579302.1 DNA-binding FadR family transcriptional regulator [Agrobacterium tumefaciens]MBP2597589.1 DNA-binding FadR family transcriptional regulator [A